MEGNHTGGQSQLHICSPSIPSSDTKFLGGQQTLWPPESRQISTTSGIGLGNPFSCFYNQLLGQSVIAKAGQPLRLTVFHWYKAEFSFFCTRSRKLLCQRWTNARQSLTAGGKRGTAAEDVLLWGPALQVLLRFRLDQENWELSLPLPWALLLEFYKATAILCWKAGVWRRITSVILVWRTCRVDQKHQEKCGVADPTPGTSSQSITRGFWCSAVWQ